MNITDTEIDDLLNKISIIDIYIFNIKNEEDLSQDPDLLLKRAKEKKLIIYLNEELNLIREFLYSSEKLTFSLTKKGNKVIRLGVGKNTATSN